LTGQEEKKSEKKFNFPIICIFDQRLRKSKSEKEFTFFQNDLYIDQRLRKSKIGKGVYFFSE